MTQEQIASNIGSWASACEVLERYPDAVWAEWKGLARRFLGYGMDRHFNRHLRAGNSVHKFVFTTLDHHGVHNEPWVSVMLEAPAKVRLCYSPATPPAMGDKGLEYELDFDEGMPTFHRFLNHLWTMTMPEPLPEDMRGPEHAFFAPVIPPEGVKVDLGEIKGYD